MTKTRNIFIVALILFASVASMAQLAQRDSQTVETTKTVTFQNQRGAAAQTFEYVITGSPTSVSNELKGCMAGGTCDSLEISTSTTNSIRTVSLNYDYFTVTATLNGGTSPLLRVNATFAYGTTPTNALVGQDPCASFSVPKSSAPIAFSSAATAALVTAVTGKKVYVCAFTITMSSGTTPTMQFKAGTGGSCGTGTANLTGVMALPTTSGSVITVGSGHTAFSGAAGAEVCITTAGTTPTGNGWLTYVQQ